MNKAFKDIQEVFKTFQTDRHNEDKGRNFNLLQEMYAKTELFDLTKLKISEQEQYEITYSLNKYKLYEEKIEDLTLPFEAMFIHIEDRQYMVNNTLVNSSTYMFTREYNPVYITGTIYEVSNEGRRNLPFTLNILDGILVIEETGYLKLQPTGIISRFYTPKEILSVILNTFKSLNTLSTKKIIADTPVNPRTEYYKRHGKPPVKVFGRNIYYVLNKQDTEGEKHIRFTGTKVISQAFKVRGHWRTLECPTSMGKDRQGNRVVKGYTWVTEYVKGDENDIVKKLRIIE